MAINPTPRGTGSSGSGGATATAMTLSIAPVSGNLLVAMVSTVGTGKTFALTGWNTIRFHNASGFSIGVLWKISDGSESGSIAIAWTGTEAYGAIVNEYEITDLDGTIDVSAEDITNVAGSVQTQSSGTTAATAVAASLAVALIANKQGNQFQSGTSWSNTFVQKQVFQDTSASRPGIHVATKALSATGAQESALTTTSAGGAAYGVMVVFKGSASATPNIASVDDDTPEKGTALVITGTNFGASQGAGSVTMNGVSQAVTAWASTQITVTTTRGTNKYGTSYNLVVTDNSAAPSNNFPVTLMPQAGWEYVNLGTPDPIAANRITAIADLASGDQLAYDGQGGDVVVLSDATFNVDASVTSFDVEAWVPTDGYGATATQTVDADAGGIERFYLKYRRHSYR